MTRICGIGKENKSCFPPSRKLFNYKHQIIAKSVDHIYGRATMDEHPVIAKETSKSKVVLIYKNGDRNFRGHHVTVSSRRFRNFDSLLNELTRITSLPHGARFIFTPVGGTRVETLDQLVDGQAYVCGSYPRLKKINYNHAPDGSSRKRASERNFIPASNKMKVETEKLTPIIKPKIITIVRNSVTRPKKCVKILLNKRTAQTYEQVLNDITGAVGVEGGCVRKLYNIDGKRVQSLTELFSDALVFIAVGTERFRSLDLPHIVEDLGIKNVNLCIKISDNTLYANKLSKLLKTSPKSGDYSKSVCNELSRHSIPALKKLPEIKPDSTTTNEMDVDNNSSNNFFNDSNEHVNFEDNNNIHSPIADTKISDDNLSSNSSDILNKKLPLPSIKSSNSSASSTIANRVEVELSFTTSSKLESISNFDDSDKHIEVHVNNIEGDLSESGQGALQEKNGEEPHSTNIISDQRNKSDDKMYTNTTSEPNKDKPMDDINNSSPDATASNSNMTRLSSEEKANLSKCIESDSSIGVKRYIDHQLSTSEDIDSFYEIGDALGDGNFAVVKAAMDKNDNTMYAIKIIDVSKIKGKEEMLKNEIFIQRESSHPNIVQLIHDFHSPTEIFLVMELIAGGDFFDLIAENIKLDEEEASLYTNDLCSGLDYLHQRNIVHRDIKPENLMVCLASNGSSTLKIADFGLAQKVTKPIFTICGTPTYVSPEILKEEGYGIEVDVWAAGVIIYIMLCGFPPFRSPNRNQSELFDLIETGEYEFLQPYWDDISESAKELVKKILVTEIKQRYTCADILRHSWLKQNVLNGDEGAIRCSRFKVAAKGIQSIQRMKKLLGARLERGENFIENITSHSS